MRKENVSGHFAAALPAGVARIAETIMDQSHRSRMLSFNLRPTPTKSVEEHQLIIDADFERDVPTKVRKRHGIVATGTVLLPPARLRGYPGSLSLEYARKQSEKSDAPILAAAVALYLNRRLWPFTAPNSWTGGPIHWLKFVETLYLNRRQPRFSGI